MTRLLRLAVVLAGALLVALPAPVRADDETDHRADVEARLEVLRKLTPEQRAKLREKLRRFRSLTPEQQERLRAKADRLGEARLRELAGRDAGKLRRHHHEMQEELDQIFELIGPLRLEGVTDLEQRYLRHEAGRHFHRHVKGALLRRAGVHAQQFRDLDDAERRARMRQAWSAAKANLFEELPAEEQTRIRALPKEEQRREFARLLAEFRKRETVNFVTGFDRRFLTRYLELPADARLEKARRWSERKRWFEVVQVLRKELEIPDDTLRLTRRFRADEFEQLRQTYEESADLSPPERRLRIERSIREIHGRAATDDERVGRRGPPRMHHLLRNGKRGKRDGRRGRPRDSDAPR